MRILNFTMGLHGGIMMNEHVTQADVAFVTREGIVEQDSTPGNLPQPRPQYWDYQVSMETFANKLKSVWEHDMVYIVNFDREDVTEESGENLRVAVSNVMNICRTMIGEVVCTYTNYEAVQCRFTNSYIAPMRGMFKRNMDKIRESGLLEYQVTAKYYDVLDLYCITRDLTALCEGEYDFTQLLSMTDLGASSNTKNRVTTMFSDTKAMIESMLSLFGDKPHVSSSYQTTLSYKEAILEPCKPYWEGKDLPKLQGVLNDTISECLKRSLQGIYKGDNLSKDYSDATIMAYNMFVITSVYVMTVANTIDCIVDGKKAVVKYADAIKSVCITSD